MSVEPLFPEFIEPMAGVDTAQGQNVLGTRFAPEHARLLAAGSDERLAPGLHHARTDEETLAAEGAILHPRHIVDEVTQLLLHRLGLGLAGAFFAGLSDEFLHLVFEQLPGPAS